MEKLFSLSLGITLGVLTLVGFIPGTKHFLKLMNTDTSHSALRVPLTAALLYAGTQTDLRATRTILLGVGFFYIAIGTAGLIDKKVGGALPSGLTKFDVLYHLAVGAEALWFGGRPGRMMKAR